jgi:hypothetical protein
VNAPRLHRNTLRSLSAFGLFVLLAPPAFANPIIVDAERRPVRMLTEDVVVSVGRDHSKVLGRYTFEQSDDDMPTTPDTHVLVYVPVLLTASMATRYVTEFPAPLVISDKRRFQAALRDDLAYADSPKPVRLPKRWSMQMFTTQIPLPLPKRFQIEVVYTQPNFPGGSVGYVPILPPEESSQSTVSFVASVGQKLRPLGLLSGFAPKRERIVFQPKHRKLIGAQLLGK